MHLSQMVRIEPHCAPQGLHRDAGYLELNLPKSHGGNSLEYELTTIWALSEFTKECGVRNTQWQSSYFYLDELLLAPVYNQVVLFDCSCIRSLDVSCCVHCAGYSTCPRLASVAAASHAVGIRGCLRRDACRLRCFYLRHDLPLGRRQ